jgi:hypothetical protein
VTRSRRSAKQAGAKFERQIADYLAERLDDDRVDRRPRYGSNDRGDIGGVRCHGQRVVIEAKDCTRLDLPSWTQQARIECGNDDALTGVVIHKRHGNGNPGEQWVSMTVDDFIAILTGAGGGAVTAATETKNSPCRDCGIDTLPAGWDARAEWYMVHDEIWSAAGMPPRGYLCIGCLQRRLGRELTRDDFTDALVNDPQIADDVKAWSWRTPRLTAILFGQGGGAVPAAPMQSPTATAERRLAFDPEGVTALLGRILGGTVALPGALCRNHPALFSSDDPNDTAAAVDLCHRCPELTACRTWAANQRRLSGVVAGAVHQHPADTSRI